MRVGKDVKRTSLRRIAGTVVALTTTEVDLEEESFAEESVNKYVRRSLTATVWWVRTPGEEGGIIFLFLCLAHDVVAPC